MKNLLLILLSFTLSHCIHKTPSTETPKTLPAPQKLPGEISIMSFNVENLFDTEKDPGKEDFTFLPLKLKETLEVQAYCNQQRSSFYRRECHDLDWSAEVLNKKMQNLKPVILQVDGGLGPDILVLVEVENKRVLQQLNKEFLKEAAYTTEILIEGNDPRGIDVAILSRLPQAGKARLHKIPFQAQKPEDQNKGKTLRGILEATLILPDKTQLSVFAGHFPSQSNPRYWRAQYVAYAKKLIQEKAAKNPVVLAGDLNITAEEENEAGFFHKDLSEVSLVSHFVGCKTCLGTHNYRGSWSFLDVMLFSKNLGPQGNSKWQLLPDSIAIPKSQALHLREDGAPARFNEENGTGVSDHFPIYVRLAPRK